MRVQFKANPPITVTEARKLLGDEAEDMTDIQIQELIDDFDIMAQYNGRPKLHKSIRPLLPV